jgi:hypothetical protein
MRMKKRRGHQALWVGDDTRDKEREIKEYEP